ncbi:MAG: hypothetical protein ABI886_16140 [Betaproteobacteria bacterium]
MADFPAPVVSTPAPGTAGSPPLTAALIAYGLFAVAGLAGLVGSGLHFIAPLFHVLGIIGVIVCYVKRSDAQGTWAASHFTWLIRTFWYSLLWSVVGWIVFWVLLIVLIGPIIAVVIWIAAFVWVLYRVIRGYLLFNDSKPIPGA